MKAGFTPGVKLVDIIFKGYGESLFYAGPVLFKQNTGKDNIQIDFTAVVKTNECDSVRCSFTVFTKSKELAFQSITLKTADSSITRTRFDTLFKNTDQKISKYRYTFYISYKEFIKLLDAPTPLLLLKNDYSFQAHRRWKKEAKEIKTKLGLLISGYI